LFCVTTSSQSSICETVDDEANVDNWDAQVANINGGSTDVVGTHQ